jgi:hypothetical protein
LPALLAVLDALTGLVAPLSAGEGAFSSGNSEPTPPLQPCLEPVTAFYAGETRLTYNIAHNMVVFVDPEDPAEPFWWPAVVCAILASRIAGSMAAIVHVACHVENSIAWISS